MAGLHVEICCYVPHFTRANTRQPAVSCRAVCTACSPSCVVKVPGTINIERALSSGSPARRCRHSNASACPQPVPMPIRQPMFARLFT